MRKVRKKELRIKTFRLGEECALFKKYLDEKKIIEIETGVFEIFTRESLRDSGELARVGDYVKIDTSGNIYPNSATFFEDNHVKVGENIYVQKSEVALAWEFGDEMCDEIEFLCKHKGLILRPECPQHYFQAPLWGTILKVDREAVLLLYRIDRAKDGRILDIDYNFVAHEEFLKTYEIIE